jgi:hypothetical protein
MKRRIASAALVVSALTAGRSAEPASTWPHAVMQASCAPWDGAAIAVFLNGAKSGCDVSYPLINIYVWQLPVTPGQKIVLAGNVGGASRCQLPNQCERATHAAITFDRYEEGKGGSGTYDLVFPGGEHEHGSFKAAWCNVRMPCGLVRSLGVHPSAWTRAQPAVARRVQ